MELTHRVGLVCLAFCSGAWGQPGGWRLLGQTAWVGLEDEICQGERSRSRLEMQFSLLNTEGEGGGETGNGRSGCQMGERKAGQRSREKRGK